jgi:hypothetical protein
MLKSYGHRCSTGTGLEATHQIAQSVSTFSFSNLLNPCRLPATKDNERQLLLLVGTCALTATPTLPQSSSELQAAEVGVIEGRVIDAGDSVPRSIRAVCGGSKYSGISEMLSSLRGVSWWRSDVISRYNWEETRRVRKTVVKHCDRNASREREDMVGLVCLIKRW